MARAQLFLLQHEARLGKGGLHQIGPVPGHNPDVLAKNGAQGLQHASQHGLAQKGLQHFGLVGMHAGALARRQNQRRSLRHGLLLEK